MPSDSISHSLPVAGIESLRPLLLGTRHMAVAGHYSAAHAAFAVLESGGNAVDAGCAAGIALGVLQSDLVDVAGVAPIMIYLADKQEVVTIAGLGPWPKALDPELFQREHGGKIPKGVLRTVVPAAPDAWITALRRYGTMSFGEVAAAATRLARDGFPMYPLMAASLKKQQERLGGGASRAGGLLPNGRAPAGRGGGHRARRYCCQTAARPRPARCSARPISPPRCNTWPTRRRRPPRAAAM